MRVYRELRELSSRQEKTALAIGNFDGCHVGHVQLLSQLLLSAKRLQLISTVLTFDPHPVEVLKPNHPFYRLTTTQEKLDRLQALGVDQVLVQPFQRSLASLSPEAFFQRFMVEGLNVQSLHVGFNFYFGKDRRGTPDTLKRFCAAHSMELELASPVEIQGERVSSSLVRQLLLDGAVERAAQFLGYRYRLAGKVVPGEGRGRGLGFPTANLNFSGEKILPQKGVYATKVHAMGKVWPSVTNIGTRPTFKSSEKESILETHLLDLDRSLYGESIEVEFVSRIRDELNFRSAEELKKQIESDIALVRGKSQIFSVE